MATIQVRDVPEDVHRIYRERAAAAGMSLQEYLRAELTRNARRLSPADIVRETERLLATEGDAGFTTGTSADVISEQRQAR